jgi:hypothetical protein
VNKKRKRGKRRKREGREWRGEQRMGRNTYKN